RLAVLVEGGPAGRNIFAEAQEQILPPGARLDLPRDPLEVSGRFGTELLAIAEQLVRAVADHVRRVQLSIEELAAYREVVARLLLHQRERVVELEQRLRRGITRLGILGGVEH